MTLVNRLPIGSIMGRTRRKYPFAMALVLLLVLLVANLAAPGNLDFASTLGSFAPIALLAMASTPSILSGRGGIDISIGPITILINIVLVVYLFPAGLTSPLVTLVVALGIGLFLGAVNGAMIGFLRYQPIVATLCMYFVLSGVNLRLAASPGTAPDNWTRGLTGEYFGWLPGGVIIVGIPLVIWALLGLLPFKRTLYAVGGNDTVPFAAGVRVGLVRFWAYALGGLLAGVAAIALTGVVSSADASTSSSYTLAAIAAVAIGGTSLNGGTGGLASSAIGAGCIFLIQILLQAYNIPATWSQIFYGVLLVIAVIANGDFANFRKAGAAR